MSKNKLLAIIASALSLMGCGGSAQDVGSGDSSNDGNVGKSDPMDAVDWDKGLVAKAQDVSALMEKNKDADYSEVAHSPLVSSTPVENAGAEDSSDASSAPQSPFAKDNGKFFHTRKVVYENVPPELREATLKAMESKGAWSSPKGNGATAGGEFGNAFFESSGRSHLVVYPKWNFKIPETVNKWKAMESVDLDAILRGTPGYDTPFKWKDGPYAKFGKWFMSDDADRKFLIFGKPDAVYVFSAKTKSEVTASSGANGRVPPGALDGPYKLEGFYVNATTPDTWKAWKGNAAKLGGRLIFKGEGAQMPPDAEGKFGLLPTRFEYELDLESGKGKGSIWFVSDTDNDTPETRRVLYTLGEATLAPGAKAGFLEKTVVGGKGSATGDNGETAEYFVGIAGNISPKTIFGTVLDANGNGDLPFAGELVNPGK